eukprot:gene7952-10790_t
MSLNTSIYKKRIEQLGESILDPDSSDDETTAKKIISIQKDNSLKHEDVVSDDVTKSVSIGNQNPILITNNKNIPLIIDDKNLLQNKSSGVPLRLRSNSADLNRFKSKSLVSSNGNVATNSATSNTCNQAQNEKETPERWRNRLWPTKALLSYCRAITRCIPPNVKVGQNIFESKNISVQPYWNHNEIIPIQTTFDNFASHNSSFFMLTLEESREAVTKNNSEEFQLFENISNQLPNTNNNNNNNAQSKKNGRSNRSEKNGWVSCEITGIVAESEAGGIPQATDPRLDRSSFPALGMGKLERTPSLEKHSIYIGLPRGPTPIEDLSPGITNSLIKKDISTASLPKEKIEELQEENDDDENQNLPTKPTLYQVVSSAHIKKRDRESSSTKYKFEWQAMGIYDDDDLTDSAVLLLITPSKEYFLWLGSEVDFSQFGIIDDGINDDIPSSLELVQWMNGIGNGDINQLLLPDCKFSLKTVVIEKSGIESDSFWDYFNEGF